MAFEVRNTGVDVCVQLYDINSHLTYYFYISSDSRALQSKCNTLQYYDVLTAKVFVRYVHELYVKAAARSLYHIILFSTCHPAL